MILELTKPAVVTPHEIKAVLLDGEDVTNRFFYVDTDEGCVKLYKLDSSGQFHMEFGEVAHETRHGNVKVIL